MSVSSNAACAAGCTCGCCAGIEHQTPALVSNRPALDEIAARIGTYAQFRASMLASLADLRAALPIDEANPATRAEHEAMRAAIRTLTTRQPDDLSIALLDACSVVADVLTFYQERIAQECFLRTATERRSVQYLARHIGYELRAGVAAAGFLAFELDTAPTSPEEVVIATGTQVMSVPAAGELPQAYETVEGIIARQEWNAMRPVLSRPQVLGAGMQSVLLRGIGLAIRPGDSILVAPEGTSIRDLHSVTSIHENTAAQTTRLSLSIQPLLPVVRGPLPILRPGTFVAQSERMTGVSLSGMAGGASWGLPDFGAQLRVFNWPMRSVSRFLSSWHGQVQPAGSAGVFTFEHRAALFGFNAPSYMALPLGEDDDREDTFGPDWEDAVASIAATGDSRIELDAAYLGIAPGSWIVLRAAGMTHALIVSSSADAPIHKYTLSGKATQPVVQGNGAARFPIRTTSVLAGSRKRDLAELPITEPVAAASTRLELDRAYLGLTAGRHLVLTGERTDMPGVVASESNQIADALLEDGRTVLVLAQPLQNNFVRSSLTICANVAKATHGESKLEALGSGDGSTPFQAFRLRQSPLTHVSAPTAEGMSPELLLRVDGVEWTRVPNLLGRRPDERVYALRTHDDGSSSVHFGDGVEGARLPSGVENVTAAYRKGTGLSGLVGAGKLTLLARRPSGVRSVNNPLPTDSAADPESLDGARRAAPRSVLTLDRIVSLPDYQAYAASFPGVTKAHGAWTSVSAARGVFITIVPAAAEIGLLATAGQESALARTLMGAIARIADPGVPVLAREYLPAFFRVTGSVRVAPDRIPADVLHGVRNALAMRFGFAARAIGQPVHRSEVIAVIQNVPGVISVDLDGLFRTGAAPALADTLGAATPRESPGGALPTPAELLLLDPRPAELEVVA